MAFVADRVMAWAGLPGRAFIPLVLGFGCNVPAVYATWTLHHPLDRLRVAIPFLACGAWLPIFTLFAFAFFPERASLVVFGLYLLGLATGLLTTFLLGRVLGARAGEGVMELPPYRFPPSRLLLRLSLARTASFVRGAHPARGPPHLSPAPPAPGRVHPLRPPGPGLNFPLRPPGRGRLEAG